MLKLDEQIINLFSISTSLEAQLVQNGLSTGLIMLHVGWFINGGFFCFNANHYLTNPISTNKIQYNFCL